MLLRSVNLKSRLREFDTRANSSFIHARPAQNDKIFTSMETLLAKRRTAYAFLGNLSDCVGGDGSTQSAGRKGTGKLTDQSSKQDVPYPEAGISVLMQVEC